MTIPPSNSPRHDESSLDPEALDQIQYWIDHPSLDCVSFGTEMLRNEHLREDGVRCIELLKKGPRMEGGFNEPAELRFDSPTLIGAGAFGLVFRAWDRLLKRDVAIKLLRPSVQLSSQTSSRFALEAEALARCRVDGIIPVFDSGRLNGNPYMVTGYINGPSLAQYSSKNPLPMPVHQAACLVREIALAVHEAHARGILHRDLKPSNILLEPREEPVTKCHFPYRPYVSDFGLAKEYDDQSSGEISDRSSETPIVGTIQYMSPEQACGDRSAVSIESDIYSLGVILFELVTGRCPHVGVSELEVIQKISTEEVELASSINPAVSIELDAVIRKALARIRTNRYSAAMLLADDLQRFMDGKPTMAGATGILRSIFLWVRRNPGWAAGWFVLWATTLSTSLFIYVLYSRNIELLKSERAEHAKSEVNEQLWLQTIQNIYRFMAERPLLDNPEAILREFELHRASLEHCEKFAEHSGYDQRSTHLLSIAYHYVSLAYTRSGDPRRALLYRQRSLALIDDLLNRFPDIAEYHFDRFMGLMLLCDASGSVDATKRSEMAEDAQDSLKRAIDLAPPKLEYQDALAASWYQCATINPLDPNSDENCHKAIAKSIALHMANPDRPMLRKYAILGNYWLAHRAHEEGKHALALTYVKQSLVHHDVAFRGRPKSRDSVFLRLSPLYLLAAIADDLSLEETQQLYRGAIETHRDYYESNGEVAKAALLEAELSWKLSCYLKRKGELEAAEQSLSRAREMLQAYRNTPDAAESDCSHLMAVLKETD